MKYYPIKVTCGKISKVERFVCRTKAEADIVAENLKYDWSGDEQGAEAVKTEVLEPISREEAIEAGYEVIPVNHDLLLHGKFKGPYFMDYRRTTKDGDIYCTVCGRSVDGLAFLREELQRDIEVTRVGCVR